MRSSRRSEPGRSGSKARGKGIGGEIIEGLTELRDALRRQEPLRRKFTVRTVELALEELRPHAYGPETVRETREALGVSQAVFAQMLAVSRETIESWEQGVRNPPDMACRLLDLINAHRTDWVELLSKSVREAPLSA